MCRHIYIMYVESLCNYEIAPSLFRWQDSGAAIHTPQASTKQASLITIIHNRGLLHSGLATIALYGRERSVCVRRVQLDVQSPLITRLKLDFRRRNELKVARTRYAPAADGIASVSITVSGTDTPRMT